MAENLILTTPKISMNALVWQGITVYTCYPQISTIIEKNEFGPGVAKLFAKPVTNPSSGEIDWYTTAEGTPRKLVDLPEAEKAVFYAKLRKAAEEILKYAEDELIGSGKQERITRGEILKLALRYPDDNALYVVGEQPVMTCWGFAPGTPGVEGCYLARLHYTAPVAAQVAAVQGLPPEEDKQAGTQEEKLVPVAAVPVASRPFSWFWLWWLFPLCALLLLFLLLCSAIGPYPAISGVSLFHWPNLFPQERDYSADLSKLKLELGTLESKVDDYVAMCKPEEKAEAPSENLVIPDNSDNVDFLEGEWLCRTGLVNAQTREPVQFSFTFNRNGKGHGTVYEESGESCTGDAQGVLKDGVLKISLEQQKCKHSGRVYQPFNIECRNVYGVTGTSCTGINSDGNRWEATFHRLR